MKHLFSRSYQLTVYACLSVEDILSSIDGDVNPFDDKKLIVCVASIAPDSFGNN